MIDQFVFQGENILTTEDGLTQFGAKSVLVENGKIKQISHRKEDFNMSNKDIYDFGSLTICPGLVDTHAHINEPGRTEWEGFATATQAAAAGGITTVIDMPLNSIPATTSLAALEEKRKSAKEKCFIDYGFWGGVIPGNQAELMPMIQSGVFGFKCFLCPSGVDEFPAVSVKDLDLAMPILAKHKVPLLIHAEIEGHLPKTAASDQEYSTYLQSRPPSWEIAAVRMMIDLAEKYGARIHIVHLSAADAIADIRKAKARGVPITVETCPHYLMFDAEHISAKATYFKCAPPIRNADNREKLWTAIRQREIDFIVSDHSPCLPSLKLLQEGNFVKAWGGISGLQFSLAAVWTEMSRRGLMVEDLFRLMSSAPANFIGLGKIKGQLAVGCDADFIVWDPQQEFVVEEKQTHHRHKLSPYVGQKLKGKIHSTFVRGLQVYFDGKFVASAFGREMATHLKREH